MTRDPTSHGPGPRSIEHSAASAAEQPQPGELQQARLLKNVAIDSIWDLLRDCSLRRLEPEAVLIAPGDEDRNMFLLLRGRLRVHLSSPDDDAVAILEPGESVGELSLLDDRPRSAMVVAQEPSRVLEVSEAVFWSLLNSSHEVALNLLSILSARLRGNNSTLTESLRLQAQYKRHAAVDALTGLYNRRWLDEVLPRQIRRSRMNGEPLSLIMVDVDHFKRFNDVHGHQAGDYVLFVVAQVLKARLRPTDLIARYGGEEFTVALPATDLSGAIVAAERAREAISGTELVMPDQTELPAVTVSLGLAQLQEGQELPALIESADKALYRAKKRGRNRTCH